MNPFHDSDLVSKGFVIAIVGLSMWRIESRDSLRLFDAD